MKNHLKLKELVLILKRVQKLNPVFVVQCSKIKNTFRTNYR